MGTRHGQRGFGYVEILLVLVVLVLAGAVLYRYFSTTAQTIERIQEQRPLEHARLAADQATLASIQSLARAYQAQNGRWPADKAAVLALLASPPRFQCAGNDVEYDPADGSLRLLITDAARC